MAIIQTSQQLKEEDLKSRYIIYASSEGAGVLGGCKNGGKQSERQSKSKRRRRKKRRKRRRKTKSSHFR
ncbi:uncharacterized [Tachysurus ichikawai]